MIKWQIPVIDEEYYISSNMKFHCFVNDESLCGKYEQNTDFFETDATPEQMNQFPENACKICYRKFLKIQNEKGEKNDI